MKKRADKANRALIRRAKLMTKDRAYKWLPWTCIVVLLAAFAWMRCHPNGKTFDIVCNLIIVAGVILIASGAVVQPDMRERLYSIKDYDATKKDEHGNALQPPTRLSDAEVAGFFVEASDKSEAGTILAVAGSFGLVVHLIVDVWNTLLP